MGTKPFLNRRFIRLQAVQRLYTFYISKHANYEKILAQIASVFTPDVFTATPVDPAQLAQEAQEARELFDAALASSTAPKHENERVLAAVMTALADYQSELSKDQRHLEEGLARAVSAINNACLVIWQLLVEWGHLAGKQAERPRLSPDWQDADTQHLSETFLLKQLQEESKLATLVQETGINWDAWRPLVEDWYYQFIRKDTTVQAYLANPDLKEEELWHFLIDKVIFKQRAIQEFFDDFDLHWAIHKHIVRKCMRQGIQQSLQNSSISLYTLGSIDNWHEEQQFYAHLTQRTLANEANLMKLIDQKSKNWALQRINVLDKAIITLALCEMVYFPTIPTKVSINEYIEIAKNYSIPKSKQFVNGLLDAIARELPGADAAKNN